MIREEQEKNRRYDEMKCGEEPPLCLYVSDPSSLFLSPPSPPHHRECT